MGIFYVANNWKGDMDMSNKSEYQGQIADLAHTHEPLWREELLRKRLTTLAGLQVLIDIDENPNDENFDPFFFPNPRDLLRCIGEYMRTDNPDLREQWSILLLTYLEENVTSYYDTQIRSDLEDRIEELNTPENIAAKLGDDKRELEKSNG
jgi:hypothetical protein